MNSYSTYQILIGNKLWIFSFSGYFSNFSVMQRTYKKDILFFAYKYYFRPPIADDANDKVIDFIKSHPPLYRNTDDSSVCITAAGDLMPYEWVQKQYCPHLWDDIENDFFNGRVLEVDGGAF